MYKRTLNFFKPVKKNYGKEMKTLEFHVFVSLHMYPSIYSLVCKIVCCSNPLMKGPYVLAYWLQVYQDPNMRTVEGLTHHVTACTTLFQIQLWITPSYFYSFPSFVAIMCNLTMSSSVAFNLPKFQTFFS